MNLKIYMIQNEDKKENIFFKEKIFLKEASTFIYDSRTNCRSNFSAMNSYKTGENV